ncbi:hypothetical protein MNBD_BACTEROID01-78 [hydrothermal vent metagenome]|uniref:Uncharacterized protein n=1 Tax=hydrothermal vent metagenome TaxID=652676 RepID=A0A3B0TZC0_9ZZZZ
MECLHEMLVYPGNRFQPEPFSYNNMMKIKLAYYRKKDWKRFVRIIDDRESMHDTWNDWHKAFLKTKKDLISQGFEVIDLEIDLA